MPWQPQGRDRKKALGLVLVLHLGLGAALLNGLAGEPLRRAQVALTTFDVPPPQPPEPDPPPKQQAAAEAREKGASDLAARPAPMVQPPPEVRLPVPPTLATADETAPVTAIAPSAGAGRTAGSGAGSGDSGEGSGGGGDGGSGTGSIASNARLLSGNLSRGDYRRIRGFGAPRGQAVLAIEVSAAGQLTRCLPFASSGNLALDSELCRLLARTRWEPARDSGGNPVPVALRYVATWSRD